MAEFQVMSVGTPEKIVVVISKLLTDLVARNDQAPSTSQKPLSESRPGAKQAQGLTRGAPCVGSCRCRRRK